MNNIVKYITEKLKINKDSKVEKDNTISSINAIIQNYLINVAKLKQHQYILHITEIDKPYGYSISLWSKDFRDIDKISDDIYKRIKGFCLRDPEVLATTIIFYIKRD